MELTTRALGSAVCAVAVFAALAIQGAPEGEAAVSSSTSYNWAGFFSPSVPSVQRVGGGWYVPFLSCGPNENSNSSMWVGLGGVSDSGLVQAGTEADCVSGVPTYTLWWEVWDGRFGPNAPDKYPPSVRKAFAAQAVPGVILAPGDSVGIGIARRPDVSATAFEISVGITSAATGTTSFSWSRLVYWTLSANTSAECVFEAPTDSGSFNLKKLPSWSNATFWGCVAGQGGGTNQWYLTTGQRVTGDGVAPIDTVRLNMVDKKGNALTNVVANSTGLPGGFFVYRA